jgi:hypothetical protein
MDEFNSKNCRQKIIGRFFIYYFVDLKTQMEKNISTNLKMTLFGQTWAQMSDTYG